MRERIRTTLQKIDNRGIAAHGTNLSRAKKINTEGFDPNCSKELAFTYYGLQPPQDLDPKIALKYLNGKTFNNVLGQVLRRAQKAAATPEYHIGSKGDTIPSIVFFHPLRPLDKNSPGILYPGPIVTYEINPIPPVNIIGTLPISSDWVLPNNDLLREMTSFLAKHGVIPPILSKLPQRT